MKLLRIAVVLILTVSLLTACSFKFSLGPSGTASPSLAASVSPTATVDYQGQIKVLNDKIKSLSGNPILAQAMIIIDLLKNKDMAGLSAYVDPAKGLRFSPYANVSVASDRLFTKAQVAGLSSDTASYTWGSFDGSGLPIDGDFNFYYSKFVFDKNFETPQMIGIDHIIGTGNTPDNIMMVYPGSDFVEFHFTGFDPAVSGLDWESLRLVFEESGGTVYLVGIVHAQWTI